MRPSGVVLVMNKGKLPGLHIRGFSYSEHSKSALIAVNSRPARLAASARLTTFGTNASCKSCSSHSLL